MKKHRRTLLTIALACGLASPVAAAPMAPLVPSQAAPAASSNFIDVQMRSDRQYRRGDVRMGRDRALRRGDRIYLRGHRGYRHARPGYRLHNGWWFPPAAFALGAVVGGAVAADRLSNAHVRWCHERYRSYRASDNTFQPYNGPRRQCWSPYS